MKQEELDKTFEEAVIAVNAHVDPFPADILLKLYAYFKKATDNRDSPGSKKPLINAFKTNALFQAQDISRNEAKRNYIETAHTYFLDIDQNKTL